MCPRRSHTIRASSETEGHNMPTSEIADIINILMSLTIALTAVATAWTISLRSEYIEKLRDAKLKITERAKFLHGRGNNEVLKIGADVYFEEPRKNIIQRKSKQDITAVIWDDEKVSDVLFVFSHLDDTNEAIQQTLSAIHDDLQLGEVVEEKIAIMVVQDDVPRSERHSKFVYSMDDVSVLLAIVDKRRHKKPFWKTKFISKLTKRKGFQ